MHKMGPFAFLFSIKRIAICITWIECISEFMLRNLCVKNVKVSILLPYFVATMQQSTFNRKEHTLLVHINKKGRFEEKTSLKMNLENYQFVQFIWKGAAKQPTAWAMKMKIIITNIIHLRTYFKSDIMPSTFEIKISVLRPLLWYVKSHEIYWFFFLSFSGWIFQLRHVQDGVWKRVRARP